MTLLSLLLQGSLPFLLTSILGEPTSDPKTLEIRSTLDIRYYPGTDRQLLDIFAPAQGKNAPVVLFVHGGGWTIGDKNMLGFYRSVARYFAQHGIVAVSINYRLSPKVQHPEHIKDVARAYAWIRRHVAEYGGDPDRIVLCGHSAGGHLVSLLATNARYLSDPELKLTDKDRAALRGVASVCGVYRIASPAEFLILMRAAVENLPVPAPVSSLLLRNGSTMNPFRSVFGEAAEDRRDASPVSQVRPGLPPFLLLNASREIPGLAPMADEFETALRDAGNQVEHHTLSGTNHNTILFHLGLPDDEAGPLLLRFIERSTSARPGK